jgi:hypothetical protein
LNISGAAIPTKRMMLGFPLPLMDLVWKDRKYNKKCQAFQNQRNGTLPMSIKIFIGHAHADADIAASIIDLMILAFNLADNRIRCTSVDGFKLQGRAKIEDQLRKEVLNAELVVSILSPTSLASTYVLFELGARWEKVNQLFPCFQRD